MKHACYCEEYGSTSAKDSDKQALICERRRRPFASHDMRELLLVIERNESRGGVQARGKVADESAHRGMPESIESEKVHFFQGLLRWQFFEGHAVNSHKNAGAVIAIAAVHKDLFLRAVSEDPKKLHDLFVGRRRPSADRDMNEANPQRFRSFFFPVNFLLVFAAEIDNGGAAEFFQLDQAGISRLGAAIQMIVDFSGVRNASDAQFFAVSGVHLGRSGSLHLILRGDARGKDKNKNPRKNEERALHFQLDADSIARDGNVPKAFEAGKLSRKGTTTNRRGTKTSTIFCVFLLTGNSQTLILRFQIRGTW